MYHFEIHHGEMKILLPSDLSDIWFDKAVQWEISNSFRKAVKPDHSLLNQIDLHKTYAQFFFLTEKPLPFFESMDAMLARRKGF